MSTTRKGTAWAREVHRYLEGRGFAVHRREWMDAGDDMTATGHGVALSVEAKNHRSIDLAGFVDQAVRQVRAAFTVPVVVIKRRGRASAGDAYAVMRLSDLADLLEVE